MQTTTENKLALFQHTQPDLIEGLFTKEKANDAGKVTSLTLALETRKTVAKRLGVAPNKENADKIDAEILRMKDTLKMAGIGEIAKLAASPEWTGSAFRISTNKSGSKTRATFALETVNRLGHRISDEQLVKALANLSEEQQLAMIEKADAFKRTLQPAVELAEVEA